MKVKPGSGSQEPHPKDTEMFRAALFLWIFLLPGIYGPIMGQPSWVGNVTHDFGPVVRRNEYIHKFRYVNTGAGPLIIDNVRTDCGCTAPTWTDIPVVPGDTGFVHIGFTPRGKGKMRKRIKVFFRGIRKPEVLWVEGEAD